MVIVGSAALKVRLPLSEIVSAPLPAAQPPVAASVFAEVIAFARLQPSFTVIVAAEALGT